MCKALTHKGEHCKSTAVLLGYCMKHYNPEKVEQ